MINNVIVKTPLTNLPLDSQEILVAISVIIIIIYLVKQIMQLFTVKDKFDCYIDCKINNKVEPLKMTITDIKEEQAVLIKDILEIKLHTTKMAASLEFIANQLKGNLFSNK